MLRSGCPKNRRLVSTHHHSSASSLLLIWFASIMRHSFAYLHDILWVKTKLYICPVTLGDLFPHFF